MTEVETSEQVVNFLLNNLRTRLSPSDNVSTAYASASVEGLNRASRPDLVVQRGNDVFIVEIKHFTKPGVLPLSTAVVTKRLFDANSTLLPKIVFATNSTISYLLRKEFLQQHVNVIEYRTSFELVDKILGIIQIRET